MEKLDEAVLFFSENSPDSPELNTVVGCWKFYVWYL